MITQYALENGMNIKDGIEYLFKIRDKEGIKMDDELIEYFVVNSELNMSPGKIAAQVAHVATIIAVEFTEFDDDFNAWYTKDQKKIILRGKQKDLEKLVEQRFYYIRDNGLTEIPQGSLTVVGLPPMLKSDARKYVKRLQLL